MKAKIRQDKNGHNDKPATPRPENSPKGQERKTPYALQWTPEMEYTTLYGKPILSFTKKELAAYVVFLIKKYDEICERKSKQIGKILFLRKHR